MEGILKDLFKELGSSEIKEIRKLFNQVNLPKGTPIVKEEESGEEVYVLKKGRAAVIKKGKLIAELSPGDIIGEMKLLESKPRTATVVALEDVLAYKMKGETFYDLLNSRTSFAIGLLKTLSSRLRELDEKIVNKEIQEERLVTLGKLGSTIIHDLKSPLSAIKGYASILAEEVEDKRLNDYAVSIVKAVKFIFDMIEDILEFGRDESSLNIREVKISRFFEEIIDLFGGGIEGENIEIELDYDEKLYGKFDPFKMKRVILNLLKNGSEAIKDEGKIKLKAEKKDNVLEFYVIDDGKGIPESIVDRIFDPFFTYKKSGSGLGMTVVKKVVDEHKGDIDIKSKEGEGTTFKISLPQNEMDNNTP